MSFGSPSSTLCRHWNDMEVVLWRVTCHSLLQGRMLAWWPYCSRPECPRGDEGIIDVRFLVGVLLQPKVRIQTRPFCMLQRDSATEYLKSPLFQISQGLSLQYVCHCDSAPEQLICFGGILMGIPLSQQPPNILQRGEGSHAFVVSVNRCPLAFHGLVGYSGEKQREADAYFPFSPYQQLSGF